MTWVKQAHSCTPAALATVFASHGDIWRCDICGKRSRLKKYRDGAGQICSRWVTL